MTALPPGRSRSLTSTRRIVAVLLAAVAVLRLGYLGGALYPDEAGYLLVARAWHLGGPNLYGHYFVDRPPGLLLLFKLASLLPGDQLIRLLTIPFAILFVASAAWAAHQLVGAPGARWAALAAAAFAVNPAIGAREADGEVFAAPLVMLAAALTIGAVRHTGRRSAGYAVLAGLVGGLAVLVKQNFVDALVFAAVLVVASTVQERLPARDGVRIAAAGLAGGSVVLLGAVGYLLAARVPVGRAWFALFGFRGTALDVISDSSLHAPLTRALALLGLAVVSGLLPMAALLVREAWRCNFTGPPVTWALGAALLVGVVGIVLGGSYWPHYLLELTPMLALAAGLWAPHLRWLQATTVAAAGCAVLVAAAALGWGVAGARPGGQRTGDWLRHSGHPGDTATVLYGHAEAQYASGDPSPYPFLWSLPMRTIDPHLTRLRALLSGPERPDWVVVWTGLDDWNVDPRAMTRLALATHYRMVKHVCGHEIWLRDGANRKLATSPAC